MALRIEIDQDECISGGKCVTSAPEGFGFDDDELAVVLPGASQIDDDRLRRIAANCPSQAITLHPA